MNDLITLACPSCGGQLRLENNTTTYTCYYCGQQHRLRVEDLEEFARCPICKRNDKVEKVKSILHKKDSLSRRLTPPENPENTFFYQPNSKPEAIKKQTISPKKITSRYSRRAILILLFSIALLVIFVAVVTSSDTFRLYPIWFVLLGVAGLIYSIILAVKGKVDEKRLNKENEQQLIRDWQSKNEELERNWSDYKEKYDREFQQKSAMMANKYSKAMERYELLYYCHRDDCVFIPGKSGFATSSKLDEFLFSESTEQQPG